ncbi:OpgC family protein [Alsobacter sp. R-9]
MTGPTVPRYVSIDFWRGLALMTIFVNHVPGNPAEAWTHKNFGFSDAAEGFVLLAGVSAALAYLPGLSAAGYARQTARMVLRAWTIYMAHLAVIALCGAAVAYGVLVTGDVRILEATQFDQIIGAPLEAAIGVATLGLQPAYLNILPIYVVFLLMAPAVMCLAVIDARLALGASVALYVATQLLDLALPSYPGEGAWYFNPLAWQLLFCAGLCAGAAVVQGRTLTIPRWLWWSAVAYLVVALAWTRTGFYNPYDLAPLPRFMWDFDKTNLSLPRLLHVLALAVVIAALPLEAWLRRSAMIQPVAALGRHSLPVFCVGTVMAVAAMPLRASELGHPALDFFVVGGGIAVQLVLAWMLEWYRTGARPTPASRTATQDARAPA